MKHTLGTATLSGEWKWRKDTLTQVALTHGPFSISVNVIFRWTATLCFHDKMLNVQASVSKSGKAYHVRNLKLEQLERPVRGPKTASVTRSTCFGRADDVLKGDSNQSHNLRQNTCHAHRPPFSPSNPIHPCFWSPSSEIITSLVPRPQKRIPNTLKPKTLKP